MSPGAIQCLPFGRPSLWWPDEVRRFLRLTASSELRSSPRVSIVAISAMTGIKRKYLYEILIGAPVSVDYCERPTPLMWDIERGRLSIRHHGPRDSRAPNRWETIER